MKKLTVILIALMMALMTLTASAETLITVSGTGETRVSADTAVIVLGVSYRHKDALTAQQMVNEKIYIIRKSLITLGIAEECINTNYINLYAMYSYEEDQEQITACNANSSLSIKMTDMDKVGSVIDTAFVAGANTLEGIYFSASDTDAAQAESLTKAVTAARKKAEILAAAAGLQLTGIRSISEGDIYSYDNAVSNFSADVAVSEKEAAYGASTVVQASKVVVAANISIVFEAE